MLCIALPEIPYVDCLWICKSDKLLGKAIEVLETEENARSWLASPQYGLGGAVPLEYAGTDVGAREVEELLGHIAYGVYS